MGTLFYAPADNVKCEKILDAVKRLNLSEKMEVCRTIEGLSRRLHQPTYNLSVCLFCMPTQRAFLEICSIYPWLDYLRVILILPDRKRETVSSAHKLMPRFISYMDDNPATVLAVLKKMIANNLYPQYE
jgi:hypothetical protein